MRASRRDVLLGASALAQTLIIGGCASRYIADADSFDTSALRSRFSGELISPKDARYEMARRTQNLAFDHRPKLIARCATTEDVVRVLEFGRRRNALIAIRSGGHSQAGQSSCDGGVVIDLTKMNHISIDTIGATINCGPGALIWQVYQASAVTGLTLPLGTYPTVGVAGLTLGGGLGFLSGVAGAACDSLIGAEIVLADGRIVTVDEQRDPDLMWALRGAGANFGIVTRLTFRAFRQDKVLAGNLVFPSAAARDVLGLVNEMPATTPDELTVSALVLAPPNRESQVVLQPCWSGDSAQGRQVIDQYLTRVVRPVAGELVETTHAQFVGTHDEGPSAYFMRWGQASNKLADAALDILVDSHDVPPAARLIIMQTLHGVAARTAPRATAFPHFVPGVSAGFNAIWKDDSGAAETKVWSEKTWAKLHPYMNSAYVNMLGDEGSSRVREAYGVNYTRLRQLKARYDHDNVFRMNQNIPPA